MASIDNLAPTKSLIDLSNPDAGEFGIDDYELDFIFDDILLIEYVDETEHGDVMKGCIVVPSNALNKAWRKGKVILSGPDAKYTKEGDIVIFPNNMGVTISGVTITGINNPKITMRGTSVAFKITSSNVTLNGFTIQSVTPGVKSNGIGVLVSRIEPSSMDAITNVNITNITFIDVGDPTQDLYGAISVRGYNALTSNAQVNDLIPVTFPEAGVVDNITIHRCTFTNIGNNAIDFWSVKDSRISNCTINGITDILHAAR